MTPIHYIIIALIALLCVMRKRRCPSDEELMDAKRASWARQWGETNQQP
jgi:hypothetical protein